MTKKQPLRKGQGRRQFFACQDRIKELMEQGYDIILTYDKLVEEGLITMSYGGFYDLVTQRKKRKKQKAGRLTVLPDPAPLFPPDPAAGPALPPNLVEETQSQPSVPAVIPKTPPLLPEQNGLNPAAVTEQHLKARSLQEKLNESVRANKDQYLSGVNSDPDLQKELDRLRGKE